MGAANFTKPDDDGWWDDDDDYWTFNDVDFMNQNNPKLNWDKVKKAQRVEAVGPAAMFLVVLEGMVYTVGSVFAACALYLAYRWSQGYSLPFLNVFNGEMGSSNPERDLELAPTRRMPITPDVIRT